MLRITFIVLTTLVTGWMLQPTAEVKSFRNAYPEQLPGTYTGGFGEDTCQSCHFDYPLNPNEGSLHVRGVPSSYEANKSYTFTIEVSREDLGKGGFQLTARYSDSTHAGAFKIPSGRTTFSEVGEEKKYVQHSPTGVLPSDKGTISWTVAWKAPEQSRGEIIFNIAANAANGDDSAFGDYIFTREFKSSPSAGN